MRKQRPAWNKGRLLGPNAFATWQGPAMVADWLLAAEIAAGRLVELLPAYQADLTQPPKTAWALYPTRSHVPMKVGAFVAHLQNAFN